MFTVMNRIFVRPEYAEAFEDRFRHRAGLVDGMQGFVRNQVLKPAQEEGPYIVLTYWESRADFERWTQSNEFKQGHARSGSLPKEAFSGPNRVEMHEVLLDSELGDKGGRE